jgi:type III pantothenate kinase
MLIGTGGFARLFEDEDIFDAHVPELVLLGLREALRLNV